MVDSVLKTFGMLVLAAVNGGTYLAQQQSSESELQQRRSDDLRQDLNTVTDIHPKYSSCMQRLHTWKRKHGDDFALKFKQDFVSGDQEATAVNECRSQTKDFWRRVQMIYVEYGSDANTPIRLLYAESHHRRFVDIVPKFEVLDGYDTKSSENDIFDYSKVVEKSTKS